VDDLIDGLVRLMGTGPALTGPKARIALRPLPQDDRMQRWSDIGLARKVMGWEPKVPLERAGANNCSLLTVAGGATPHSMAFFARRTACA
jgi:nucleoside-diphosphate-sugar epimerase